MPNPNKPYGFQLFRSLDGSASLERVQVDTNTTVVQGSPLVRRSTATIGKVIPAAIAHTAIIGFAVEGVTGAAGVSPWIHMIPASPDNIFVAQAMTTGNASAGLVGKTRGIRLSGVYFGIHATYAATSVLQIVGLKPGSAFGTYAELLCIVKGNQWTGQK